jgi:multiple sugar transport system substrate-binding protein
MIELKLSIMYSTNNFFEATHMEAMRAALADFEAEHHVRVGLQLFTWDTAWSELVKVALYKTGPDISEIGTTWVDNFVSLQALRPFEPHEEGLLGEASTFLPSLWQSGVILGKPQRWAIPWEADTRLIYYRRDLLQQAGIDEQTAFQSFEHLNQTLARLQQSGVAVPFAFNTLRHPRTLHFLASWVWGAGGRFISPSGKHVLFHTAGARDGLRAYFNLRRYLAPAAHEVTDQKNIVPLMFLEGKIAVLVTGYWLTNEINQGRATPEVTANFSVARIPQSPYIGGGNLVVWRHNRHPEAAIALLHYLTSLKTQTQALTNYGRLPARLDALYTAPFTTNPHYQPLSESLQNGQSFQTAHLWGLIEDKLATAVSKAWSDLLAHPELSVEEAIRKYIDPLANELNHHLAA